MSKRPKEPENIVFTGSEEPPARFEKPKKHRRFLWCLWILHDYQWDKPVQETFRNRFAENGVFLYSEPFVQSVQYGTCVVCGKVKSQDV